MKSGVRNLSTLSHGARSAMCSNTLCVGTHVISSVSPGVDSARKLHWRDEMRASSKPLPRRVTVLKHVRCAERLDWSSPAGQIRES